MKFLCENCKAKYQIGDDKVAGKTVRMKCRRCGFDIHVNASTIVDEPSAAPWPDASATMQGSMAIVTPELAASLGLRPPPGAATPSGPTAPSALPAPSAAPAAPGAPRPVGASSLPTPAMPRPIPAPQPVGTSNLPKPAMPRAVPAPPTEAKASAPPSSEWNEEIEEESTAIMAFPVGVVVAAAQAAAAAGTPRPTAKATTTTPSAPAARPLAAPTAPAARPLAAPAAPAARPLATTPRPALATTPRPAGLPRPGAPRPLAPSGQAEPPPVSASVGLPAADVVPPASVAAPRSVETPAPAPAPALPSMPSEGWYVGVAGAPFGPTSISVIREKLHAGEINTGSLVWRDGQGEWKPLDSFPEMLGASAVGNGVNVGDGVNVDNNANAARAASLASNVPAATPTPAPYSPLADFGQRPAEPLAAESAAPSPPPPPSAPAPYVSAFSSPMGRGSAATAVLTDIFPERAGSQFAASELLLDRPLSGSSPAASPVLAPLPDPFSARAAPPADVTAGALATAAPMKAPSSPDGAAGGFASGTGGPPIEIDESVVPKQRRPLHPMAYAFIAFAAVFGGVAAYVLLAKPQQIVVVQAAPSANVATVDPKIDKPQASVEVAVGEPTTDSTGEPIVRQGALPGTGGPKPKTSAPGAAIDTSGFTSIIPGPSTAQPPPPNATGQLSAGEIQGVVAQNQAIVKRKCWQPALESRAVNAPTNARVNGSITIGAGGNVESASASGGERDFPGLSSCIASRMKGWKFPASSSSTPVNVPFVFAGQ